MDPSPSGATTSATRSTGVTPAPDHSAIRFTSDRRPVLGEDPVDLAERLDEALLHAHREQLLHRLAAGEAALDRHPGAPGAGLGDGHDELVGGQVGVIGPVVVPEPVVDDEPIRRRDFDDLPEALRLIALGPG